MELKKFTGTNNVEHYVNPLKISRITRTPAMPITTPDGPVMSEPSIIIHLDTGFSIEIANSTDIQDLIIELIIAD